MNIKIKQALVDACAHTVLVDNQVTASEANLLRAIAMTLDCPIPPFLNPNVACQKSCKKCQLTDGRSYTNS